MVDEVVEQKKPKLADVVSALLNGEQPVKSATEVIDRFHKGGEENNRDLPMLAALKNPRVVECLEVNGAFLKSVGFGRCGALRDKIIDIHCRASVGGDRGKWRELTVDATGRAMAQEFEIKKRSKTDQFIGTG